MTETGSSRMRVGFLPLYKHESSIDAIATSGEIILYTSNRLKSIRHNYQRLVTLCDVNVENIRQKLAEDRRCKEVCF